MLNNSHLSRLIHEQAAKYGQRTALSWRDYEEGVWKPVSWNEFSRLVRLTSVGLLTLGVKVQENVAVFSQNKPEGLYVDFGAFGIRAVTIPFYATSSSAQVAYMVNDAAIRFVFVGEQEQYYTTFSVISVCPTLEKIIIFSRDVVRHENDHLSVYFDEFLAEAEKHKAELTPKVDALTAESTLEDTANILYTSGTTGNSKGVIITHGMYYAAIPENDAVLPLSEKDVILNFLPFTHILERIERTSALERRLILGALKVGARCWTEYLSKGKTLPPLLRMKYAFYQRTVVKLLRKTLGLENANFFPTAGAAVSPEVEKFVHAAGICMVVGYGLTESTATVSCDFIGKPTTLGSVGRVIGGVEIKFGENDEILLRGKSITPGYYKKEDVTRETIDEDGWFHTGDSGYMKDGELFLKERIKDLFKTSNGKYIAPQMIESKFVIDKFIDQTVIVADKHKFVSALIVPNYDLLRKYAEGNGLGALESREALCASPEIHEMIKDRIDLLQQDLAHYEQVKRFILLPKPFTIATGELTNTLKVKRRVVYEKYAKEIEQIYIDAEKETKK